jgi:hypothetical protein
MYMSNFYEQLLDFTKMVMELCVVTKHASIASTSQTQPYHPWDSWCQPIWGNSWLLCMPEQKRVSFLAQYWVLNQNYIQERELGECRAECELFGRDSRQKYLKTTVIDYVTG